VIPQDVDLDQLRQTASPLSYRLIVILDLSNVYRSWWFILLLLLLTGNLFGCLIRRLPKIPREWRGASEAVSLNFSVSDSRPPTQVREILTQSVITVMGYSPEVVEANDQVKLVWVKQRIFLLAFPLIHAAVIVILIGGLIGLVYGVKGNIRIQEGESGREFLTYPAGDVRELPFEIAVDTFTLARYPTGQPKEYRSDVRLLKEGKEVLKGSILVNHPLTFDGISLYQANYELLGVKHVKFAVQDREGKRSELAVRPGEAAALPGTDSTIKLVSLDPGATIRGPGVAIEVEEPGASPRRMEVFRNDPEPVKLGNTEIRFLDYEPLYATGLQIGYDPGAGIVWLGCVLLIVGFSLTLFTNLSAITVTLKAHGSGTSIQVTGRSRKDRAQFRARVEAAIYNPLKKSEPS
jgi:cytochrome c biogenesis protein